MEMKIYERSLQALLSSAPRSRVLARLASLAQIGELARRLVYILIINMASCRIDKDVCGACSQV